MTKRRSPLPGVKYRDELLKVNQNFLRANFPNYYQRAHGYYKHNNLPEWNISKLTAESFDKSGSSTMTVDININGDVAVGLSDQSNARNQKEMLELVNRLCDTGVQTDIDLPMICVIGNQSAGKSSLIESICGITLPRSAGTCTRCPTECKLSHSDSPWRCLVTLHFHTDPMGIPIPVRHVSFGDPITSKSLVEDCIRRAQCAILNPSKNPSKYLYEDGISEGNELSFSKNYVSLEISGKDLADLSFVDLPGLIASVGGRGHETDIELVKSLVTSYIEKPSCVILLTVACETDFENQGAHHLAKKFDPKGERTVGVLTKPDRIPSGEEPRWLKIIRNETEPLVNNWYCVKQPSSEALSKGITWTKARQQENDYFTVTRPWCSLEPRYHNYLRTSKLIERLSIILSELIAKRLPEIQGELVKAIQETEARIRKLPRAPSGDPVGEVFHVLNAFSRDLFSRLEGTPEEDGILQTIRPYQQAFKRAIRNTAPNFVPWEKKKKGKELPKAQFLQNEEGDDDDDDDEGEGEGEEEEGGDDGDLSEGGIQDSDRDKSTLTLLTGEQSQSHPAKGRQRVDQNIYVDEVLKRAQSACTRELPDSYPFIVHQAHIKELTIKWRRPAMELFDRVSAILRVDVDKLVEKHFAHMGKGAAKQSVLMIVNDHLNTAVAKTRIMIEWLLSLEQAPMTLNTHYFSDYKDKFLAEYRALRNESNLLSLSKLKQAETIAPSQSSPRSTRAPVSVPQQDPYQGAVNKALSGLNEIGISVKATELSKLLPPDPMEPALDIMASVRAYFQVAYKRFVDMVPMAIDNGIVLGFHRGIDKALQEGLQITEPDGYNRCKRMVEEFSSIAVARQEVQKKMERLQAAQQELRRLV